MTSAVVAGLALVTGLLAVLVAGLLRSHAEIIKALHDAGVDLDPDGEHEHAPAGLGISARPGSPAFRPTSGATVVDVRGESVLGGAVHVALAGSRHRTLLAFLSSTCTTCRGFWEALGDPTVAVPGRARLVIVVRDLDAESPSALASLTAPHVTTVHATEAWNDYAVPGAPYFVLVDGAAGKVLGEGTAPTWPQVRNLLENALGDVMDRSQADREAFVDGALKDAGIEPGDPALYPDRSPS
jgi:hypothetical protein